MKVLIALISVAFVVLASLAARGKSSTFDEPVHAFSSWLIVNQGDFRVNPEHPALWKYVAGAGLIGRPLPVDLHSPRAENVLSVLEQQWSWTRQALYLDPANAMSGEALVARARLPMPLFGLCLIVIVARWAWVWSGPKASLIASLLLALDPNFIAHSALVTNDVASAAVMTLAVYLTWRLGTKVTVPLVVALALTCAVGLGIKFTCVLLALMLGVLFLVRIVDRSSWPATNRLQLKGFARRAAMSAVVATACAVMTLFGLWATYQFRTAPTADGRRFNDGYPRLVLAHNQLLATEQNAEGVVDRSPVDLLQAAKQQQLSGATGSIFTVLEKPFLPQAWTFGVRYAAARSVLRDTYLLDESSNQGSLAYFPVAILVKTPTMTLIIAAACVVGAVPFIRSGWRDPSKRWKIVCLALPPCIYFAIACTSNLNIGIRHILPVYPPMYVACGMLISRFWTKRFSRRVTVTAAIALVGVETLAAFPNYIDFFNFPSGGSRGGLQLLGDSNLDWGQDLKALSVWYHDWRKSHPDEPFYLSYFGTVPPKAYGIEYINAPPGTDFDPRSPATDLRRGAYAVSASCLQAFSAPRWRDSMERLRQRTPDEVINGTIYIYYLDDAEPRPSDQSGARSSRAVSP